MPVGSPFVIAFRTGLRRSTRWRRREGPGSDWFGTARRGLASFPARLAEDRELVVVESFEEDRVVGLRVTPGLARELLGRHRLDRIEVEGEELLAVESCGRLLHAVEVEVRSKELVVELLAILARAPAVEGEEVAEDLGQVARPPEVGDVDLRERNVEPCGDRFQRVEVELDRLVAEPPGPVSRSTIGTPSAPSGQSSSPRSRTAARRALSLSRLLIFDPSGFMMRERWPYVGPGIPGHPGGACAWRCC